MSEKDTLAQLYDLVSCTVTDLSFVTKNIEKGLVVVHFFGKETELPLQELKKEATDPRNFIRYLEGKLGE